MIPLEIIEVTELGLTFMGLYIFCINYPTTTATQSVMASAGGGGLQQEWCDIEVGDYIHGLKNDHRGG